MRNCENSIADIIKFINLDTLAITVFFFSFPKIIWLRVWGISPIIQQNVRCYINRVMRIRNDFMRIRILQIWSVRIRIIDNKNKITKFFKK